MLNIFQPPDVAQVHEKHINSLQNDVDILKASLESADDKKAELEAVVEKNEFLKNENYRLEEELIKLRGNFSNYFLIYSSIDFLSVGLTKLPVKTSGLIPGQSKSLVSILQFFR